MPDRILSPGYLSTYFAHFSNRGSQAAIVVYDITNKDTFVRAKSWVRELKSQADPKIVIALAGNKCDLESHRMVKYEEAHAYADENGLLFLETSAKNELNVNEIFFEIAKKLPKLQNQINAHIIGRIRPGEDNTNKRAICCNN